VGAPLAWRPGFRKLPGELMGAALSRDGRYLACALSSGGGMALDLAADEYSRELTSPDSAASVAAVAFAGDPPYVVAGMGDLVQMHSIPTGRYDRLQKLDRGRVTSVAVAPRGDRLAVGGDLGEEKSGCIWLHRLSREGSVWHASDTRVLANPYETAIRFVSFSPEGDLLVSYDDKGALVIYDTEQAAPVRMLNMPEPYVRSHAPRSAAFSPDSRQLAAAGDRRVILWDVVTWRERPFEELHTSPITCLAWSRDGQWVVSASADGLAVWEAASGRACGPLQPLDGASDVRTLLFLGDGEWLLSGASDKRFLLWNWRQVGPLARQQEAELRR
jgi:WD40 repeat protein